MFFRFLLVTASVLSAEAVGNSHLERRLDNGVGWKPALGWNSWNQGGCNAATATAALNTANAFISLGLDKLGYSYVNIDDCWSTKSRDSSGNLVADPSKWPQGIKSVTDQIHSLGLKFGLYGDSGTATCSGFPGSQGYETQDAQQLAAWGVDYWKYDNCNTPGGSSIPRYTTMSNALVASGRKILYSLCNWGADSVWTWGAGVGNYWRVGGDITNSWSSVASIAASNAAIAKYAQPGGFNDFDMLEIGNGGLSTAEERAHFGIWAISKSPLLLGTDLTKISAASLAIIKNADVIAINQDSLGLAATYFQPSGAAAPGSSLYPYYSGKLSDGYVIGLVAVNGAATLSVDFKDVPGLGSGPYSWKELYTGNTGSGTSVSVTLVAHDMAIFKVSVGTSTVQPTTTKAATSTSSIGATSTTSRVTSTTSRATFTTSRATSTTVKATTTFVRTSTTTSAVFSIGINPPTQTHYGQCAGIGYTGPTVCNTPYVCTFSNDWYSQCL